MVTTNLNLLQNATGVQRGADHGFAQKRHFLRRLKIANCPWENSRYCAPLCIEKDGTKTG